MAGDLDATQVIETGDLHEATVPPINAVLGNLEDLLAHPTFRIAAVILVDDKRVTGIENGARATERLDLGILDVELDGH
jgi:hypothetical protein